MNKMPKLFTLDISDFFKGRIDLSMILPVAIGLLYAGTGNWSDSRWTGALAIMGIGPAAKMGYERGYWTENPEITRHVYPRDLPVGPIRDEHGRFTSQTKRNHEDDGR